MELPKYHHTFTPILSILKAEGTLQRNELIDRVMKKYYNDLPTGLLEQKIKSGQSLIRNRISWGIVYLKQAKLIHQPKRGHVQITDKGKGFANFKNLTLSDIVNDPDFLQHRQNKKEESSINATDHNETADDLIESGFSSLESKIKEDLLEKLKITNPYFLEKVVLALFERMGYGEVFVTAKSGDGGIDGIINQDQLGIEKIYVQVKRYKDNKVREGEIRNFIGAMSRDTEKGIFVTTSNFDQSAITKAHEAQHKIILIDGIRLVTLMLRFNVGVQIKAAYEVKELDEDFFEEN